MRAELSTTHPDGIIAIMIFDEGATLVIHPPESPATALVESPADISSWAPDLLLVALSEPAVPTPTAKDLPVARISLVDQASFVAGQIVALPPEKLARCVAVIADPLTKRTEVLAASDIVPLVAQGLVLQVLSGVATVASRDLDGELARLNEEETPDTPLA